MQTRKFLVFVLFLMFCSTLMVSCQMSERVLNLNRRISSSLCDRGTSLLGSALSRCSGQSSLCNSLKTANEYLPKACRMGSESVASSVKALVNCMAQQQQQRYVSCIQDVASDLKTRVDSLQKSVPSARSS